MTLIAYYLFIGFVLFAVLFQLISRDYDKREDGVELKDSNLKILEHLDSLSSDIGWFKTLLLLLVLSLLFWLPLVIWTLLDK